MITLHDLFDQLVPTHLTGTQQSAISEWRMLYDLEGPKYMLMISIGEALLTHHKYCLDLTQMHEEEDLKLITYILCLASMAIQDIYVSTDWSMMMTSTNE